LTASAAPTGTRCWSATPGTNHAEPLSCGSVATAKPKLDKGAFVTSCQLAALSLERKMPL